MARTKQTARKTLQIPNLLDTVKAKVYKRRTPKPKKEIARSGKPRGEPRDGCEVLIGYPGSWDHTIYETIDHKNAAHLFRHQSSFNKMKMWSLEGECARVREYVENSGLYNVVVNYVITYDKVAVSSFCERYYGEVDTFQLPFCEMAVTPDDAEQILGMQVEGKSTNDKFNKSLGWDEIYVLTRNLFGWDKETTDGLFVPGTKYPNKEFKLVEIREMYVDTLTKEKVDGLSDMECRYTAAGYLLYVLASVVFPDIKGNRVSANLLQLLDSLEDVNKFYWGMAIVAVLNGQFSQASRERTSQINENLTLLQVWIFDHFPSLFKDNEDVKLNPKWSNCSPTGTLYLFTGSQKKEQTNAFI
ncbi:protein MAIN-LIKE 1-like [Papaver somniferum]|uniref:protein MAIN-LIKE 1-like n=1 Tax=Papaver somniferum TaxID=3469 RepID=UPI000E701F84|nr:protein MAIN-LIKE 1-like [Papaver somniferum]